MKHLPVFTLFLLFLLHSSCGETHTSLSLENFRKEHNGYSESQLKDLAASGVPVSMVRHLRQDRSGNILIAASWGGVFLYDGKSFVNLTIGKIDPHRFWDVIEDRRGNLWLASTDSGVYCYDGRSFLHYTTGNGLANNLVMSVFEDKTGNIWFCGGGLSRYDGKSFRRFTTKDGVPPSGVRAITEDKNGQLWIATADGPGFYNGETFTVLRNKDDKPFKNVWSIIEDKKGNIWFGDVEGLWRYDGRTFTRVSQRNAYEIIEDKKGNIWTTGALNPDVWALSRYDQPSLYDKIPVVTEVKSGGRMDFLGILEANDGSIWFGSGAGVHRYEGNTFTDFKNDNVH